MKKQILKSTANKCAKVVADYAKQEAKKNLANGKKVTIEATKKYAKKGFSSLKGLFK